MNWELFALIGLGWSAGSLGFGIFLGKLIKRGQR